MILFGRAEWKKGTKAKHEYLSPANIHCRKKEENPKMSKCSSSDYEIGIQDVSRESEKSVRRR